MPHRLSFALFAAFAFVFALVGTQSAHAQLAPVASLASPHYDVFEIGDPAVPRPAKVQPGLMLVGGGEWPTQGFRWFVERAGHGHIVVLEASYAQEIQDEFYNGIGGVASVRTFRFKDRDAASDPALLDAIRRADGIFISGGDQARYVRYWKDTPLSRALDAHVFAGKPLGGTSAGLAILGGPVYGALDDSSMTSERALADPYDKGMTLVHDFLHLPYLAHVITDTHFDRRGRLGRLIGFMARLQAEGDTQIVGLGVDQEAALCIDGEGIGHVWSSDGSGASLIQPQGTAERVVAGKPLQFTNLRVTGIGPQSRIDMRTLQVTAPSFVRIADVVDGKLTLRDATAH